jgi:glucokinase
MAVDIGGTKFAAAIVDEHGRMHERAEVPVGDDPDATLAALVATFARPDLVGVGIGSAGPIDSTAGTLSPVNIPAWRAFPVREAIADLVPGVPSVLAGDAQCMAFGEWWRGGHGTTRALMGVVVSTGIGAGLVLDGTPVLGPTGNAGHFGHVSIDPSGPPCACGGVGCVEAYASGPSMARWAQNAGWHPADGPADAKTLAADAAAGSPIARAAFARAAGALAAGLLNAAALCDLDSVVIGGGVAAAGELLLGPLRMAVADRARLAFTRRLRISATVLGRDAGLLGAAALALNTL